VRDIDKIREFLRKNPKATGGEIIAGVPIGQERLKYALKKHGTGIKKLRREVGSEGLNFSAPKESITSPKEVEFNNRLAEQIKQYWQERGHEVSIQLTSNAFVSKYRGSPLSIKSTGIPTGSELR
jgi:hypothetical protein